MLSFNSGALEFGRISFARDSIENWTTMRSQLNSQKIQLPYESRKIGILVILWRWWWRCGRNERTNEWIDGSNELTPRAFTDIQSYLVSLSLDAPELAGMPSIAFKIAAWLWSNGYQSADGSSPNTGPLKHYVTNTTYDFALMSYAIFKWEGESTMAKQRFPFWMKVIKVGEIMEYVSCIETPDYFCHELI